MSPQYQINSGNFITNHSSFRALCDTNQTGKLNSEQFALAMWMVDRKKKGIDPPVSLTPEMIPPSMRPNAEPIPVIYF